MKPSAATLGFMANRMTHVFFDATDTLLRVKPSVGWQYSRIAAEHGVALEATQVDAAFKTQVGGATFHLNPDLSRPEVLQSERHWWRQVVSRTVQPLVNFPDFDAYFESVFEFFGTAEAWELLPGAHECLEELRQQGYELCILSNMDSRLYAVLDALGIRRFFSKIYLAFEVGFSKPDIRFFRLALDQSNAQASQAALVGDSLRNDVHGARDAGLLPVLLKSGDPPPLPVGCLHIRQLAQLPAALQNL